MLSPEVWNFPPPKVITSQKKRITLKAITENVELNSFYKSAIITCPDELHTPQHIVDALLEDSDYYKVNNCSLHEFLDPIFIHNFVKAGKIYCLTSDTNCMVHNCAAVTPDGILTLHLLEPIYQTLGLEGRKIPHNYYEVKIDLNNIKNYEKTRHALRKLHTFSFYITWEPDTETICPSSIAKYFCDINLEVTCHSLEVKKVTPDIKSVPTLVDADIEEMVEWVGMLAHEGDLRPTEGYVSLYSEPECSAPLPTSRISLLIVKGFLTPNLLTNVCKSLSEYVGSRDLENYWASLSIQSMENCLWQWSPSSPKRFQSQNCSSNIFFSKNDCTLFSIGQLKYS